ncbi:MAG TPA: dienelactone hydrolase family protein [Fodinibius sp.]|nr:dienelactone hydrolase family protein [Fodinibius sp.]
MRLQIIILLLVSLTAFSVSCSSTRIKPLPENSLKPGWHEGSLQHDGLERVFLFYIPQNLPDNPPVVILLHGGTRSMNKLFNKNAGGTKEWPAVAEDEGFLLLVPNGTGIRDGSPTGNNQQWNDCRPVGSTADDVGFISELISWADQKASINNNRVYVTGVSNGGVMAYRLARELDNKITAIAAFIANKPKNSQCNSSGVVPVMMVNGTEDPTMPFNGGQVSNGGRGKVLSTEATVDFWANQNSVSTKPVAVDTLQNINQDDESHVIRMRYGSSQLGAPAVLYKVVGGGHLMPSIEYVVPHWIERLIGNQNNDVEGARITWQFLSQHSK